jgi:hypothetical protein
MARKQHAYINRSGDIRIGTRKQSDEARLPDTLGVLWDDDQSNNQIVTDLRYAHDYQFSPVDDTALAKEYADQLIDMLF